MTKVLSAVVFSLALAVAGCTHTALMIEREAAPTPYLPAPVPVPEPVEKSLRQMYTEEIGPNLPAEPVQSPVQAASFAGSPSPAKVTVSVKIPESPAKVAASPAKVAVPPATPAEPSPAPVEREKSRGIQQGVGEMVRGASLLTGDLAALPRTAVTVLKSTSPAPMEVQRVEPETPAAPGWLEKTGGWLTPLVSAVCVYILAPLLVDQLKQRISPKTEVPPRRRRKRREARAPAVKGMRSKDVPGAARPGQGRGGDCARVG